MSERTIHSVGIIMNGVTGRMGLNQHLRRSICAIMRQGGVELGPNETIMPQPVLVGRNEAKLDAISEECGGLNWTTDLDGVLNDPSYSIYFDSQTTDRRATDVKKAIAAGKHIYCEKPVSNSLEAAPGGAVSLLFVLGRGAPRGAGSRHPGGKLLARRSAPGGARRGEFGILVRARGPAPHLSRLADARGGNRRRVR
jgi:hypothetical protein